VEYHLKYNAKFALCKEAEYEVARGVVCGMRGERLLCVLSNQSMFSIFFERKALFRLCDNFTKGKSRE
jgi:hypothetical protein